MLPLPCECKPIKTEEYVDCKADSAKHQAQGAQGAGGRALCTLPLQLTPPNSDAHLNELLDMSDLDLNWLLPSFTCVPLPCNPTIRGRTVCCVKSSLFSTW